MRVKSAPHLVAGAIWILSGCGSTGDGHRIEITEERGVRTVINRGGPRFDGSLFTFEHLLTLRQDEKVPASLLGSTMHVIMGEDGRYYVADGRNCRIAVYGPDGVYQHDIGQFGRGPGEFDIFFALVAVSGDTVQVFAEGCNAPISSVPTAAFWLLSGWPAPRLRACFGNWIRDGSSLFP